MVGVGKRGRRRWSWGGREGGRETESERERRKEEVEGLMVVGGKGCMAG